MKYPDLKLTPETLPQPLELLSRKQAAAYLNVSVHTLAVWATTRRYGLPFVKVGRLVKYRKADLDTFILRRTVDAARRLNDKVK